ncbi:apolipoprotein N-acyltransferase [Amnibacterium flavum]|uniref:Apolipoprotein N-acyltransferase n=1 Tax=Amnibacterium flavum TaxID=2173173 RepID=A0A2V1HQ04_9MICO|nr:apolipoprotein N-acyltransferase [Amnibacterium flavum]PVZ94618.1 apolipoprotein N-acyltransferase [Amnibacterium flavum]
MSADRRRPLLPLWAALLVALSAGWITDLAFPDTGVWPLAFVGAGLVLIALQGRRPRSSLLVGFVFGMSFYLIHIQWATLFLGVVPWLALSTLESLFVAVGMLLITLAYAWVPRVWPTRAGRVGLLPVVIAGLWTAREGISAVWPYGGFSWGRLAMSESEGPLRDLFPWLGMAGVSFVMVWLTALTVAVAGEWWRGRAKRRILPATLPAGLLALGIAVSALIAVPGWQTSEAGTMSVAAVQGNTPSGYFDQRDYQGQILDGHIAATLPALDDDLDVIVWPEGAADLDPLESTAAAEAIDLVAQAADVPVVLGTITERGDDSYNSSLLWQPGVGVTDLYDKRHPVPFGEYVPDREFWEPFAPDLIGLIGREYTPGTTDPVFDIDGVLAGVNICFDIVDDALMRETAIDGAEIIFAQTNNADFGRTDESVQQLAIARIRALELGRSVVNISTVGSSAVIAPDGSALDSIPVYTTGLMRDDVPLREGLTPAAVAGGQVEQLAGGFGLLVLLIAGVLRPRRPSIKRR